MRETIRWLHLTDLHVGMADQDWLWPRMRDKFRKDLRKIYKRAGPWDLVLFTGDLAQKGADYNKVDVVFDDIWTWFEELGCDPKLLAVPGNHDLKWQDAKKPAVGMLEKWASDPEVREGFWKNPKGPYRRVIETAFADYDAWWKKTRRKPPGVLHGLLPGDFSYTFAKGGLRLGIVGLNSAFLQLTDRKKSYRGGLVVDPRQFNDACKDGNGVAWAESHHACLLMTHHPPEWLGQKSRELLKSEMYESFCLHLCGHNHLTRARQILTGGADDAPRLWLGRSVFGAEKADEGKINRSHGYVAGELRVQGGKAYVQFMPRRCVKQGSQWNLTPDQKVKLPADHERRTRAFRITLLKPIERSQATRPAEKRPAGHPMDETHIPEGVNLDRLLPKIAKYLRDLPNSRPQLYEQIRTALRQELPELTKGCEKESCVDIADTVEQRGVNAVLEALYRWLDGSGSLHIQAEAWREVLTHLVVLAAANPGWLPQARTQEKHGGVISVTKGLQPLSAAILIGGLFDVAIRIEGRKPTGYVPMSRGTRSRGYRVDERFDELLHYLEDKFKKEYLSPQTESLDEDAIMQMLRSERGQNKPLFLCLAQDDPLVASIKARLRGLLTVLQETVDPPSRLLEESFRLVKNLQDVLNKLQQMSKE